MKNRKVLNELDDHTFLQMFTVSVMYVVQVLPAKYESLFMIIVLPISNISYKLILPGHTNIKYLLQTIAILFY